MLEISPSDIEKIEEIGELEGYPVKLIKTTGGFYIAIGKKKGKIQPLATASHAAIAKFMCEKMCPDFKPSIMKTEGFKEKVVDFSSSLNKNIFDRGYSLYSVQESDHIHRIVLNHHYAEVASVGMEVDGEKAYMDTPTFNSEYRVSGLRKSFYEAVMDAAENAGAKRVSVTKEDGSQLCVVNLKKVNE